MEGTSEAEDLQFKWGKKRGTKKGVEFYESFIYDGSEYCLYDCVVTGDSSVFFVAKIINICQYNDQREHPRTVELLWFFKPSEVSTFLELEGVQDVLEKELFLASGKGVGLSNENPVEAIYGKCNVLCISKDTRNPQPSDEEIKLADFLFRRTFDVTSNKILEKIDDQIAGVDVKYIFNKTSIEKKASVVQKDETDVHGTANSLKPNRRLTSDSVRQNEHTASDFSGHGMRDKGYRKEQEDDGLHKQLARKKSTVGGERSNRDSGRCDGGLDCFNASGSRINDCHGKRDQENEVTEPLAKQKSRCAEERCTKDSYYLDDMLQKNRKSDGSVAVSDGRKKESQKLSHDGRKDIGSSRDKVTRGEVYSQKPSVTERKQDLHIPRFYEGNETNPATAKGPFKKPSSHQISKNTEEKPSVTERKQDLHIPRFYEGNATNPATAKGLFKKPSSHQISKNTEEKPSVTERKQDLHIPRFYEGNATNPATAKGLFKKPSSHQISKNTEEKPSVTERKQDLHIPRFYEGNETNPATAKGLFKKPSSHQISKNTEEKVVTDANYKRHYQAFEVTQNPNVEQVKWIRDLTWEENLRCAEGQGTLVLLQNLVPTYTSSEVEDIVYSALKEKCIARMIERTSYTIPHIGEALVIFMTKNAAERAVKRLDEGCLLLSNGRTLVASHVKMNPPVMPPLRFPGHIKLKAQMQDERRNAVATSHSSQKNTIEFDFATDWCLYQERKELTMKNIFERQMDEKKKCHIKFKPKGA